MNKSEIFKSLKMGDAFYYQSHQDGCPSSIYKFETKATMICHPDNIALGGVIVCITTNNGYNWTAHLENLSVDPLYVKNLIYLLQMEGRISSDLPFEKMRFAHIGESYFLRKI